MLVQKEESTINSEENLRDIMLLDSDSNATIFYKKDLVDKVLNSENSIIVEINRDSNLKSNKKYTILLFEEKY